MFKARLNKPRTLLTRAVRSQFVRGVASLSTGSFFAALLTLITAPILSRLYTPTEYGVLATFMGIAVTFGGIGSWQLEQAIIVEKDDQTALVLVQLCCLASVLTSACALVVVFAIKVFWRVTVEDLSLWLFSIPVLVLAGGATATLEALANRDQRYALISRRRILAAVAKATCSLSYGFLVGGANGLLIGYCAGSIIPAVTYVIALRNRIRHAPRTTRHRLLSALKKHRRFPLFTLPANYAGNLSMQMPVYALAAGGFLPVLGQFNRARQLLTMPLTLLGSSLGQVFKRRAAIDFAETDSCRPLFLKTAAMLFAIGVGPTILFSVFAPDVFEFVLGRDWRQAGHIARILAPMLLLRLVCSPLSATLHVVGAQRADFVLSVVMLVVVSVLVWLPRHTHESALSVIIGFSVAYAAVYLAYIIVAYKMSGRPQIARQR